MEDTYYDWLMIGAIFIGSYVFVGIIAIIFSLL